MKLLTRPTRIYKESHIHSGLLCLKTTIYSGNRQKLKNITLSMKFWRKILFFIPKKRDFDKNKPNIFRLCETF